MKDGRMEVLKTYLKAIPIMVLAVWGAADVVAGFNPRYDLGGSIFWGVLMLLGAFILYRAWF
jgi:hypothetical protein